MFSIENQNQAVSNLEIVTAAGATNFHTFMVQNYGDTKGRMVLLTNDGSVSPTSSAQSILYAGNSGSLTENAIYMDNQSTGIADGALLKVENSGIAGGTNSQAMVQITNSGDVANQSSPPTYQVVMSVSDNGNSAGVVNLSAGNSSNAPYTLSAQSSVVGGGNVGIFSAFSANLSGAVVNAINNTGSTVGNVGRFENSGDIRG